MRVDPDTGQLSLFPYRFDVIPVELISSIYEGFVHSAATTRRDGDETKSADDVHYTPLTAVSMVLDQVFHGLTGDETVWINPTQGLPGLGDTLQEFSAHLLGLGDLAGGQARSQEVHKLLSAFAVLAES